MSAWIAQFGVSDVWQLVATTFPVLGTLVYASILVFAGNAAASRLQDSMLVRRLATTVAGVFLIGFGFRLTTN